MNMYMTYIWNGKSVILNKYAFISPHPRRIYQGTALCYLYLSKRYGSPRVPISYCYSFCNLDDACIVLEWTKD